MAKNQIIKTQKLDLIFTKNFDIIILDKVISK